MERTRCEISMRVRARRRRARRLRRLIGLCRILKLQALLPAQLEDLLDVA